HAPPPPPIYPLSLHDALPISIFGLPVDLLSASNMTVTTSAPDGKYVLKSGDTMSGDLKMEDGAGIYVDGQLEVKCESKFGRKVRSEEHTSELQSRENLVCRLL